MYWLIFASAIAMAIRSNKLAELERTGKRIPKFPNSEIMFWVNLSIGALCLFAIIIEKMWA